MPTRREVLKELALLAGASLWPWSTAAGAAAPERDKFGPVLPRRNLGRTGLTPTILVVGGHHEGRASEAEAEQIIETAMECGIRTFETAELYQSGRSEDRYGRYLTQKYREHVLIFTKTMAEDAPTARTHLEDSLRRIKVDYLDLWQLHDVRSAAQAERRVAGVLDVMLKAKEQGKVRHIGFTGHATWKAHARVLALTREFETCQMPINVADPSYESFIEHILPTLVERQMGVLAMKTLAFGAFLHEGVIPELISIEDAFRFVWSLPVSALVSGMDRAEYVRENSGYAARFKPLNAEERKAIIAKVAPLNRDGRLESGFKS